MSPPLRFVVCQLVVAAFLPGGLAVRWLDISRRMRSLPGQGRPGRTAVMDVARHAVRPDFPGDMLALSEEESIVSVESSSTIEHTNITRYQQTYKGIPIYDASFTIESDATSGQFTGQATGQLVNGSEIALTSVTPQLTEDEAFLIACREFGSSDVRRKQISLVVFCLEDHEATLAFRVSFFGIREGQPSRPTYFIDSNTGILLRYWDSLASFRLKAEGGNEKIGKLLYGLDMPYLQVKKSDMACLFKDENVIVYNGTTTKEDGEEEIMKFACDSGPNDSVNGGYSPASDAFYLGQKISEMFKLWAKSKACKFMPLEIFVHYAKDQNAAFFDGEGFYFSDGQPTQTYPLVVRDVVAHEVAHCFTETHSGLEYVSQSGAIDESFSDLAGEAVKLFISGTNDWKAGSNALRSDGAVRYLCDQSRDGQSIVHTKDYTSLLDVHYLSGVFNKAYCTLAKRDGWDVGRVFQIASHANRFYWHPTSDFDNAGCGLLKAAYDLGHTIDDVQIALEAVGINLCSLVNYIRALPLRGEVSGLKAEKGEQILLRVVNKRPVPKSIYISTAGTDGDVDLYVSRKSTVSAKKWTWRSAGRGNKERVEARIRENGELLVMLLPKRSHFSDVTVRVRGV